MWVESAANKIINMNLNGYIASVLKLKWMEDTKICSLYGINVTSNNAPSFSISTAPSALLCMRFHPTNGS